MKGLKEQTLFGVAWNFLEIFGSKGSQIITTLLLAWYLVPNDYALVAMIAVFIALSAAIVDGGLGQALIRKVTVTETELNTVFWVNILVASMWYAAIFLAAPLVADFYEEPQLALLLQCVSLSVFFQAASVIPKVVLNRALHFKQQMQATLPASVLSSLLAIILAYWGCGVWALIAQIVSNACLIFIFLCYKQSWRPARQFDYYELKSLWKFAKYIILDGLLAIPFQNMYLIVLPKFFTVTTVGLYFFAMKALEMLSALVTQAVVNVTFPALSQIQDDPERLKLAYRKLVSSITFLSFPLLCFIAALAPLLFTLFLPEKWANAAGYFQLMALGGILYPLAAVNLIIMKVKGKSHLLFYVGLFKKAIAVCIFVYTIQLDSIEAVLWGHVVAVSLSYLPNVYYSYQLIGYTMVEQVIDFLPQLILTFVISALILAGVNGGFLTTYWDVCWVTVSAIFGYVALASVLGIPGARKMITVIVNRTHAIK